MIGQQLDQAAVRQILLEQPPRIDRDADPRERRRAQRIRAVGAEIAGDLDRRVRAQSPLAAARQQGIGDAVVVSEVRRHTRHPARGEIGGRGDHDPAGGADTAGNGAAVTDRTDADREIEIVRHQTERVIRQAQVDLDARLRLLKPCEHGDEPRLRQRERRGQPHLPAERAMQPDRRLRLVDRSQRAQCGFIKGEPLAGQRVGARGALEQRRAEIAFERADLARDCGLGHFQPSRRAREARRIGDGDECPHPAREILHGCLRAKPCQRIVALCG